MRRHGAGQRVLAAGVAALLVLGAGACSDDDDDAANGADGGAEAALARWCDAIVELTFLFNAEEPPASDAAEPLLEQLVDDAPREVADDVEVMADTARDVLAGDAAAEEAFGDDAFTDASRAADELAFDRCDARTGEVSTVDYAFVGLPTQLEAGLHILRVLNEGEELHELVLLRRIDDGTRPLAEVLDPSQDPEQLPFEEAGFAFVGEPGGTAYLYADLEPGSYAAVCFLPVGATDFAALEALPEDTPSHYSEGMVAELSVTG